MKSIPRFGRGHIRTLMTHRDHGLEIVLVDKGALNWHVEGRVERVTAGSVYFSLPWQEHGSVDEFEPGHHWHWVQIGLKGGLRRPRARFEFHPALGISAREAREISALLTRSGRHCYPATPRMAWLIPTIVEELTHPGRFGPSYGQALVRLAVFELVRCIESRSVSTGAAASEDRVARFIRSLSEQSADAWSLERMAKECNLGRSRFAALCRRLTGDSPMTLINRLRVDCAKAALKSSNAAITAIALECGFGSSQYFARVFRHFTGMDARSYRRRHTRSS